MSYAKQQSFTAPRLLIKARTLAEVITAIRNWSGSLVEALNKEFQEVQTSSTGLSQAQTLARISLRV